MKHQEKPGLEEAKHENKMAKWLHNAINGLRSYSLFNPFYTKYYKISFC